MVNAHRFLPVWLVITIVIIVTMWLIYYARKWKVVKKRMGNQVLELNDDQLRLFSPDQDDPVTFEANQLDEIIFKEEYKMQAETLGDIIRELRGKYPKNYLIVRQGGNSQRYDFELDSHYMIVQLEKVIKDWTAKGFPVRRMET